MSKAERRRARHHRQAPVEPLPSLNLAAQHGSNISFVPAPVISPEIAPVGIEWHAPIGCDHTGFFFEALTYVLALDRKQVPVSFNIAKCPQSTLDLLSPEDDRALTKVQAAWSSRLPAKQIVSVYHSKLCQADPPAGTTVKERGVDLVIVRTMTEAATVPDSEIKCLQEPSRGIDQVWLPSAWHTEVFSHAGAPANKLAIVPEAVDVSIFHPGPPTGPIVRGEPDSFAGPPDRDDADAAKGGGLKWELKEPFVFVSVFKWEYRKGWDILLHAYFSAFTRKDNVVLKLRTYKPGWEIGDPNLMAQITDAAKTFLKVSAPDRLFADLPRVEWIEKLVTQHELRNLYASSSAFVLPTRGEGWGLPVVEAMAVGLPVICTNASGPTAYLTKENSFELQFSHGAAAAASKAATAKGGGSHVILTNNRIARFPAHVVDDGLVEPSAEHLQMLMRKLYNDPKKAAEVGSVASADIARRFSPSAVADAMLSQIHRLLWAQTKAGGAKSS